MSRRRIFRPALALALILSTVWAVLPTGFVLAGDVEIALTSVLRQSEEPITYYATDSAQISTLDPQLVQDATSMAGVEQLFLGLTDSDPSIPGNVVPEVATEWSFDETGTVWTFTLRNDIPWVRWDPVNDEGEIVRMVTAYDFEYGIKRSCDPRLAAYYTAVVDKIILGCNDLSTKPTESVTDADYNLVQVQALDDTTLVVNLQFPAGYFFSQTAVLYRAAPREVIEEYGNDWTQVGHIVTNGAFVLDEWIRGVRRVFLRSPFFPEDMQGPGNLERVVITVVEDQGTRFALYQADEIDRADIPSAEVQAVLESDEYAEQVVSVVDLGVFYFSFAYDKAPFDDVHARRAFSAAVDRNAFIQQTRQGRGIPMIHLTPPGMFGAPPINEVGVGYDPEYARAEIELAGYPDCEEFPYVEVVTFQGAGDWAEFLAAAVESELGCDPNMLTIEELEFSVLIETINPRNATEDRPNLWTMGWNADYPDANNWVADVLACEGENEFKRPCAEVDDLIDQAARESDPAVRKEIYYRIEEMFFSGDGEFPIVPLYLNQNYALNKPWLSGPFETDGLFGTPHYDWRSIDQEAQLAARGD